MEKKLHILHKQSQGLSGGAWKTGDSSALDIPLGEFQEPMKYQSFR